MKILIVSDLYPPFYDGGYEINCRDTVEALMKRGHDVTVLTSSWGLKRKSIQGNVSRLLDFDPAYLDHRFQRVPKLFAFCVKRYLQFYRMLISYKNYDVTRKIISQIRPNAVFFWRLGHVTLSPALAAQDAGFKMFFRIEDYSFAQAKQLSEEKSFFLKRWYRSLMAGKGDFKKLGQKNLLVISGIIKEYYVNCGFSESDIEVLSCGLPAQFLRDQHSNRDHLFSGKRGQIRLVFVGRLEPEKGPDVAIKAVAKLKKEIAYPAISLDIIGQGNPSYLKFLEQLAARFGVDEQVKFMGRMNQNEILERFQFYDALLFTSRYQEPFGRVVIEGMAQGLPVIAAKSGAIPEIITNFENGVLVLPDNPDDLADAIEELIANPDSATRISQNAFAAVLERYTIDQIAARLEEYILRLTRPRINILKDANLNKV